jgi:hypothetical protein
LAARASAASTERPCRAASTFSKPSTPGLTAAPRRTRSSRSPRRRSRRSPSLLPGRLPISGLATLQRRQLAQRGSKLCMRDRPMNCDPPRPPNGRGEGVSGLAGSRLRVSTRCVERGGLPVATKPQLQRSRVRTDSFWVLGYEEEQETNDLLLNAEALTAEHVSFPRRCALNVFEASQAPAHRRGVQSPSPIRGRPQGLRALDAARTR